MSNPTVIFVLGMHRSGTSALSGALAQAGVWMGDDLLEPEAGVNDKGFWEHRELVRLNEALLEAAGCRWFSVWAGARLSAFCRDSSDIPPQLCTEAEDFARRLLDGHWVVAIKDPRLCLLADFWQPVFEQAGARVAACNLVRHPQEVAASLERRDGLSESHSHALWLDHVGRALAFSARLSASHVGLFEDLMAEPDAFVADALSRAGLTDLPSDSPAGEAVDSTLRHHQAPSRASASLLADTAQRGYETVLSGRWHELAVPEPDATTRAVLEEIQALFERYNHSVITAQQSAAELSQLGAEHERSLATIAERDATLRERTRALESLGREHREALDVIAERDDQLKLANAERERLGQLHEHALAVIAQKDDQLDDRNTELERLGQMHSHALEVIGQKDEQIERFEKSPLGRLYRLGERLRRR